MKEMVYKEEWHKELLYSGEYKDYKYAIYTCGVYPTAYIENKPNFKSYKEANEVVSVHGGMTYRGQLKEFGETEYIGWDYGHSGDFVGYYDPVRFATFKRWTTQEIFDEVKKCIDALVDKYGVQMRFV